MLYEFNPFFNGITALKNTLHNNTYNTVQFIFLVCNNCGYLLIQTFYMYFVCLQISIHYFSLNYQQVCFKYFQFRGPRSVVAVAALPRSVSTCNRKVIPRTWQSGQITILSHNFLKSKTPSLLNWSILCVETIRPLFVYSRSGRDVFAHVLECSIEVKTVVRIGVGDPISIR